MIKHKWIGVIAALLMGASVLFIGVGYLMPSVFENVAGAAEFPYVSVMDKTKVPDIQIVADEKEWASMLENATAEEYIPATVIIDGEKIENVGIRPKGNSSLSMVARDDTTDRYSFKIEFDHYITGQTWQGLDKLVVNNMQGDATYMKEYLSYDLMDYAGVAVPLYAFSNISVNGEAWGFYLAVEALEDSYAQRVYGNDHGKLYKPESMGMRGNGQMNEFIEDMQGEEPGGRSGFGGGFGGQSDGSSLQYIDDEISSYSAIFENAVFPSTDKDYTQVINALKKLNTGEDLEKAVDVEATLKYFAAHTVIVNLDSYVSNMCHNYYLYEEDGRLTMLPWDFNLAFGGFQSGNASSIVNFPIDTPVSGVSLEERPILAKLLEVPEYSELYHSYLDEIVDGYFNSGLFSQTIDSLDDLISSCVDADPTAFYDYSAYQSGVSELKKLGILRAQSIEGQLNGSIPATSEGQKADPGALVDASDIDLSALGSMGGGFGGNQEGGRIEGGAMRSFDRESMQKALEIIRSVGDAELTEEQLSELQDLGVTEEQIAMFKNMEQGGFGGGGGRPGGMEGDANARFPRESTRPEDAAAAASPGLDTAALAIIAGSAALLAGGLLFVIFYKRRRSA